MKQLLALALFTLTSTVAVAQAADQPDPSGDGLISFQPTGNALVAACDTSATLEHHAMCFAYIHGVIDDNFFESPAGHDLCIPDGVTNGQLVKVILNYADKHPEKLNQTAQNYIVFAIAQAWGAHCK
jgi:hypothetical protein